MSGSGAEVLLRNSIRYPPVAVALNIPQCGRAREPKIAAMKEDMLARV
jgi:hypothetical protein